MPNCPLTLRTVKGSKLTFNELDGNFVSLQNCINVVENNLNNLVNNTLNNRWYVPSGTTVTINDGYQGFVYGDLYVEGLIDLVGDSQLVILNGDIILSGGTISGTGVTYLIDIPEYNTFLTGGTYNTTTQALDLSGNYGFNAFSIDLSYLNNDVTVTGGTYDSSTGVVTFYNNSGGTFQVSGFLTGYTDYYTTGATLNGSNLEFDRTDSTNAYSVDLSSLKFTGNTLLECIPDIYVSNIHSCSPLYINPNDEGNVYFGSTNSVGIDVVSGIISANTINGGVFYGDGSNLTGVVTGGGGSFTGGTVSGSTQFLAGLTASSTTTDALTVVGSGSTSPIFSVLGSNGQLFSVSDDLTGDLFTVSTALGDPILQVYDNSTILIGNYLVPLLNTTIKTTVNTSLVDIYAIPVSAYTGAFFDYTVNNGSNLRAGSIKSVWDGSNIVWDEVKTNDLGSTTGLIFSMSISGGTAILQSSGNTSGWTVKTSVRTL